MKPEMTRTRWI